MKIPFTEQAAKEALARASASLRAAGIVGVWLDTSGAGWTESYAVGVEEAEPLVEWVHAQGFRYEGYRIEVYDLPHTVPITRLRPAAVEAVRQALDGLDPGERIIVSIQPERCGDRVWPARALVAERQERIQEIEAEIAELRRLEKLGSGS